MKTFRPLILLALFSVSACGGAGTVSSAIPQSPQSAAQAQPQSQMLTTQSAKGEADKDKDDHDSTKYTGQITGCNPPVPSCIGTLTIKLDRDGNTISGTWTQVFKTPPPPLHDKGTFTGTITGSTRGGSLFTATFMSPQDAPCTITVTGTIFPAEIDATYAFNTTAACPVTGGGTITLHRVGKGDDD